MYIMAYVYVYGALAITDVILSNRRMQVQNFDRVPCMTVITVIVLHMLTSNKVQCLLQFCYHGYHLIGLRPSFTVSLKPI